MYSKGFPFFLPFSQTSFPFQERRAEFKSEKNKFCKRKRSHSKIRDTTKKMPIISARFLFLLLAVASFIDTATSQHIRGTRSSSVTTRIVLEGKDKSVGKNTASEKAAPLKKAAAMKAESPGREAKSPKKEVDSLSYTPTQDCLL